MTDDLRDGTRSRRRSPDDALENDAPRKDRPDDGSGRTEWDAIQDDWDRRSRGRRAEFLRGEIERKLEADPQHGSRPRDHFDRLDRLDLENRHLPGYRRDVALAMERTEIRTNPEGFLGRRADLGGLDAETERELLQGLRDAEPRRRRLEQALDEVRLKTRSERSER